MKKSLFFLGLLAAGFASAQTDKAHLGKVGINILTPQATIDIRPNDDNRQETATTNEGILIPKLSKTRVANIEDILLVEGTLVYVTDDASSTIAAYTGNNAKVAKITEKGYYYYNGSEWVPVKDTNTTYTGSTSVALNGTSFERAALTGDVTAAANSNATTVTAIQGKAIANTAPTSGQVLKWNGTQWAPAADANSSTNIYNADGTLTGVRTVNTAGHTLTVEGTSASPLTVKGNSWSPLVVNSTNTAGDGGGGVAIHSNDFAKRVELSTTVEGNFRLWANGNRLHVNRTTGNVGIGTETPTAKLDIAGKVKIADGTQQEGRVLTSDANGLATWQALSIGNKTSVITFRSSPFTINTISYYNAGVSLSSSLTREVATTVTSELNEIGLTYDNEFINLKSGKYFIFINHDIHNAEYCYFRVVRKSDNAIVYATFYGEWLNTSFLLNLETDDSIAFEVVGFADSNLDNTTANPSPIFYKKADDYLNTIINNKVTILKLN